MIDEATIRTLSATPPPSGRRRYENVQHFRSAATAQIELAELAHVLGIETPQAFSIAELNGRIRELRAMLATRGSAPPPPAPAATPPAPEQKTQAAGLREQHRVISDPFAKTEFYRKHSAAMDGEFKAQSPTETTVVSTGEPIIDFYNTLTCAIDRTEFYREHSAEMDSAYRRLGRKSTK